MVTKPKTADTSKQNSHNIRAREDSLSGYNTLCKGYNLVKFISLGFIILSGLIMAYRTMLNPIFDVMGYIPTVTLFIAHIMSSLTLISSVIFITVFNLYNRRPIFHFANINFVDIIQRWFMPILVLAAGLTGLVIYEPFRWIIPFWAFNLGWDFIYSSKTAHLWLTFLVIATLSISIILRLVYNGRIRRK